MKVGLVVPHIFMHRDILPQVIFSPGQLALDLTQGLCDLGVEVTLFSPGPVDTPARNVTADLSYFEQELQGRGYGYVELLKRHPLVYITLARQVQSELIARAFAMANAGELDVVHVYLNEEDIALPFAQFCRKPVVFTHHDPFSFLVRYKNVFPKYAQLSWLSISQAQRRDMPPETHWVGNIHHGVAEGIFEPKLRAAVPGYVAYLGRMIESKGLHLAIAAVQQYNAAHPGKLRLKIAGKHYAGNGKDMYWQERIEPLIDGQDIEYVGFIDSVADKQALLGGAKAVLVPSLFDEPFGMVMIEALACGTPVIGLDNGAIPEVVQDGVTGYVVETRRSGHDAQGRQVVDETGTVAGLVAAMERIPLINRQDCRDDFESRFTLAKMVQEHLAVYRLLSSRW